MFLLNLFRHWASLAQQADDELTVLLKEQISPTFWQKLDDLCEVLQGLSDDSLRVPAREGPISKCFLDNLFSLRIE